MLPKQKRMSFKLPPLVFCTNGHHSTAETSRHRSYLNRCWQCPCGYREETAWQTNILACRVHRSHCFCEATPKTEYCRGPWPYVLSWFFWDPAVEEHKTRHSRWRSTGRWSQGPSQHPWQTHFVQIYAVWTVAGFAPQTGRAQLGVWSTTKLYKQPLPIKNKSKWQHLQEFKKISCQMSSTALMVTFGLNRHDVRLGWLTRSLLARLSFLKTELFACRLPTSILNHRHSLHVVVFLRLTQPSIWRVLCSHTACLLLGPDWTVCSSILLKMLVVVCPKLYTVRTVNRTFFRGFPKIQQ